MITQQQKIVPATEEDDDRMEEPEQTSEISEQGTSEWDIIAAQLHIIKLHSNRVINSKLTYVRADQAAVNEAIQNIQDALMSLVRHDIAGKEKEMSEMRAMMGEYAKEAMKDAIKALEMDRHTSNLEHLDKIPTPGGRSAVRNGTGWKGQGAATKGQGPTQKGQDQTREKPTQAQKEENLAAGKSAVKKKTPTLTSNKKKPTYAAVIGLKETNDGLGTVREELVKRAASGDIDSGFTEVRNRRGGKVLIITEDEAKHRKLVKDASRPESKLTVQPTQETRTLKIIGVEGGLSKVEVAKAIVEENREIFEQVATEDATRAVVVIRSILSFNGTRED